MRMSLQAADRVPKEGMLLTLHAVIDIDSENTLLLSSSVNKILKEPIVWLPTIGIVAPR